MDQLSIINEMKKEFKNLFSTDDVRVYFSPGRINLIGEHTDYNGGYVFPCAITLGTYALVSKRDDDNMSFSSMNMEDKTPITFSLKDHNQEKIEWVNYPKGVIEILKEEGYKISHGLNILFYGNLPNGAGLSSSASIEVLTAVICNDIFNLSLDRVKIAQISQRAEREYVGVNCGIMDQFAVSMGKKDNGILLDCQTLKYEYSPLKMDEYKIIITNTNKKHKLGASAYNERRAQCDQSYEIFNNHLKKDSLCDYTTNDYEKLATHLKSEVLQRRVRHAISENERCKSAYEKLNSNDMVGFGKLLNASHKSLKEDYEVTGIELDTLAEIAQNLDFVLGSRMTGAGFGGCTISLVKKDYVEEFKKIVEKAYTEKIGYKPSFYVAEISDGARKLE